MFLFLITLKQENKMIYPVKTLYLKNTIKKYLLKYLH